jgi:hypothetical protein
VIGQKDQDLPRFRVIELDASERGRAFLDRVRPSQLDQFMTTATSAENEELAE